MLFIILVIIVIIIIMPPQCSTLFHKPAFCVFPYLEVL